MRSRSAPDRGHRDRTVAARSWLLTATVLLALAQPATDLGAQGAAPRDGGDRQAAATVETGRGKLVGGAGGGTPNIIFILVDDDRALELEVGFGRSLASWNSAMVSELIDRGTVFDNFFNPTSYCCPARASYLTGMYSHNHGIYGNNYNVSGGNGGWRRFWELGHETNSLGKWMQDQGYLTVLVGKFLNQYPNLPGQFVPENYVPVGWDEWYGTFTSDSPFSYYDFRMNENGVVEEYDDGSIYLTDLERDHAVDFINRTAPTGEPFFLFLSSFAPHGPIVPAHRHANLHEDEKFTVPAPPSFNEADVSDKPQYIQDASGVFPSFWNSGWNSRLDMSLAIDELIEAVFDALTANNLLDTTYVLFTSDNGLMWGEHRINGKAVPYEESIRFPLIVRGPGVPEGVTRPQLVANIDLAPTILELAGAAAPPPSVDGESIVKLMEGDQAALDDWRDGVLIELLLAGPSLSHEYEFGEGERANDHTVPAYSAVRTLQHLYVEYETGEQELYDLVADPYQIDSLHLSAPPEVIEPLQVLLANLRQCAGAGCEVAARRSPDCSPPLSGDWLVTESCTMTASGIAPGDVIVEPGAVLAIDNGVILEIDLVNHKLGVHPGGGVRVHSLGSIR